MHNQRIYTGPSLETGGTSINSKNPPPPILWMMDQNIFDSKSKVLDYGSGKYGRVSNFLRSNHIKTYSFDPFHGQNIDGWNDTSSIEPNEEFDIGFSTYVLNVVPTHVEDCIINAIKTCSNKSYHITRNMDIFDDAKKFLQTNESIINFFIKQFATEQEEKEFKNGNLTDETILEFCRFGFPTSRGFQRIPYLEEKGFSLIKETKQYKIYQTS